MKLRAVSAFWASSMKPLAWSYRFAAAASQSSVVHAIQIARRAADDLGDPALGFGIGWGRGRAQLARRVDRRRRCRRRCGLLGFGRRRAPGRRRGWRYARRRCRGRFSNRRRHQWFFFDRREHSRRRLWRGQWGPVGHCLGACLRTPAGRRCGQQRPHPKAHYPTPVHDRRTMGAHRAHHLVVR